MTVVKKVLITTTLIISFTVVANAEQRGILKEDAQVINAACEPEAAATGCGGEVVGKGLLKCMGNFKKAHQEFRFSAGCRSAMKRMKEDNEYQNDRR